MMYGLLFQPIGSRWPRTFLPTTAGFRGVGSVLPQSALLLGPSSATVSPERILTRIDLVLWRICHRYRLAWCQPVSGRLRFTRNTRPLMSKVAAGIGAIQSGWQLLTKRLR